MRMSFAVAAAALAVAGMDYLLHSASAESSLGTGFCIVAGFYGVIGLFHRFQAGRDDRLTRRLDAPMERAKSGEQRDAA